MASLQMVDDTDLKAARAEVEAFRELDESVLAAMDEKELSAHASLASRSDASTQYMDLVYSHLKDAAIEEKVVCYAEVGFEVSGGGFADPEVAKLDQEIRYGKRKLEQMPDSAAKDKLMKEIDEKESAKRQKKELLAEQRHSKQMQKLDKIETLIMNPLDGVLKDDQGNVRSLAEVEAFVLARRKQEDLLLANMKKQEAANAKASIEQAKKKHELEKEAINAGLKQSQDQQKTLLKIEKERAAADKAKANEGKAKAEEEKARADAEKVQLALEKAKEEKEQAKAAEGKAKADADKERAALEKAKADYGTAKADEGKAKAEADKERAAADKAKAKEEEAKAKEGKAKAKEEEAKARSKDKKNKKDKKKKKDKKEKKQESSEYSDEEEEEEQVPHVAA